MALFAGHLWWAWGVMFTLLALSTQHQGFSAENSPTPLPQREQPAADLAPPVIITSPSIQLRGGDLRRGILLRGHAGEVSLINTGTHAEVNHLLARMKEEGITSVRRLILTGADSLHLGGVTLLLKQIPIAEVVDLSPPRATVAQMSVLQLVRDQHIPYHLTLSPGEWDGITLMAHLHPQAESSGRASVLAGLEIDSPGLHLYIEHPTLGNQSPLPPIPGRAMDLVILSPGRRNLRVWREVSTRLGAPVSLVQAPNLSHPTTSPSRGKWVIYPLESDEPLVITSGAAPSHWRVKTPNLEVNWPPIEEKRPHLSPPSPLPQSPEEPAPAAVSTPSSPQPGPSPRYLASAGSSLYHRASCPNARRISDHHKVGYSSPEEAQAANRTPAKCCHSPGRGEPQSTSESREAATKEGRDQSSTR